MAAGVKPPVRALAPALAAAALAGGCAAGPVETPAEAAARRQASCQEAGFAEGTPDFRLCLILQQTNERLGAVERRLAWIEQQTRLPGPYFGPGWW